MERSPDRAVEWEGVSEVWRVMLLVTEICFFALAKNLFFIVLSLVFITKMRLYFTKNMLISVISTNFFFGIEFLLTRKRIKS